MLSARAGPSAQSGLPVTGSAAAGLRRASVSASALLDPVLRFSNWPAYIDVSEDGSATTLDDFRAAGPVVTFDHRGIGASDDVFPRGWSTRDCAADALAGIGKQPR